MRSDIRIHPTAEVSPGASIGSGTTIWHQAQVREGAIIGENCIIGKGAYIDAGVRMGDNVKIQNGVSVYHGVTLGSGVFCGPHCVFTNDLTPRAVNPDGTLQKDADWQVVETFVGDGASIGANATILCGVTIGKWAMIGAGAVVSHDVPSFGLVYGNPARLAGFVCACGGRLKEIDGTGQKTRGSVRMRCVKCKSQTMIPRADYSRLRRTGKRR